MPIYCKQRISLWLTGAAPSPRKDWRELAPNASDPDQNADCFIGGDYTSDELIEFFTLPRITPTGREEIASAICYRLDWLSEMDGSDIPDNLLDEDQRASEIARLTNFICNNRPDFELLNEHYEFGVTWE